MLLGACSDSDNEGDGEATSDSGGGDADAYIEASAEKLQTNTEGLGLDEETATCFAAAGVNTVGVENFKDADISPEDLANADSIGSLDIEIPDGATEDLAAALEECDLAEAFSSALIQGMVAASGSEVSDDSVACMGEHIDESDFAHAAAVSTLSTSSDGLPGCDDRDPRRRLLLGVEHRDDRRHQGVPRQLRGGEPRGRGQRVLRHRGRRPSS